MLHRSILMCSCAAFAFCGAALADHRDDRKVSFPPLQSGDLVLAVDLHTHSVFSDGQVWPSIRVEEAHRDGIDLMAVTEYLEHQPHKDDIPHPDRNRSYEIASADAERRGFDVMIVNGAEITRGMPPGHVNAVFVDDANAILQADAEDAIRTASDQGAFVFWNHPNWLPQAPDGVARMTAMHQGLIKEGALHGVEVANGTLDAYSEHALGIALKYDLTILGTSDIHGLVDWTHDAGHGGHRPMTLVFAGERSAEAVKASLFEGRTVAWHYDDLIGREENVAEVVSACLQLTANDWMRPDSSVLSVTLRNDCPLSFVLLNKGRQTIHNYSDLVRVERNSEVELHVRTGDDRSDVTLDVEVLNTQIRPRRHLTTSLSVEAPASE